MASPNMVWFQPIATDDMRAHGGLSHFAMAMQLAMWQSPEHQHLALEAVGYQEAYVDVKETPAELVYEEVPGA